MTSVRIDRARAGRRVARPRARRAGLGRARRRSAAATTSAAPRDDVDLLVIATPDAAVAEVAARDRARRAARSSPTCPGRSGSPRSPRTPARAVLHPLVALPDPERGAERLRGAWFGVAAEATRWPLEVVAALGGRAVAVAEDDWVRYHAAAVIASNHLVALLGQVERVAARVGRAARGLPRPRPGQPRRRRRARPGRRAHRAGPARRPRPRSTRHLAALPAEERAGLRGAGRGGGPPVPVTTVATIAELRAHLDAARAAGRPGRASCRRWATCTTGTRR